MKKIYYPLACCLIGGMLASCGGGAKKSNATEEATAPTTTAVSYSKSLKAPETDSLNLPIDADGYITIFDGKSLDGWRGYGKDKVPSRWIIEDGCLKFCGTGTGEGQTGEGGDLISPISSRILSWNWNGKFRKVVTPVSSIWLRKLLQRIRTATKCWNPSISLLLNSRCWTTPIIRMPSWVRTTTVRLLPCMI